MYIQDFFSKGYTTEFSFHYNRDDPSIHFDDNGFLVRPSPIGLVVNDGILQHGIRAYYLGWTSNGHIGRLNVSHAFYQALGHDTLNPIAGTPCRHRRKDGGAGAVSGQGLGALPVVVLLRLGRPQQPVGCARIGRSQSLRTRLRHHCG